MSKSHCLKTALVAINAQYIHTSLSVRSLAAYCHAKGCKAEIGIQEYTINQEFDSILQGLYALQANVYLFSCYIWNLDLVKRLGNELAKLLPHAVFLAGGPQVSYTAAAFLQQCPAFTAVLCGEGEGVVYDVLQALAAQKPLDGIAGTTTRHTQGPAAPPVALDDIPFPYNDLDAVKGRILYYESMRGCPYRCSYCLSSAQPGVRLKSLGKVYAELQLLLEAKPRQVKFVDRTFNCNEGHALAIWQFLMQQDNGFTNFHFELAAETLTDRMLTLLAAARPGLFQFEIGVQSCNPQTLGAIRRPANLEKLFDTVNRLQKPGNIHLHLDLIAGLPFEDFESFAKSLNRVYAAAPHQLQLGFLKLLPGSPLASEAEGFGIVAQECAPFEVLYTRWLHYDELVKLKRIAAIVELYYNSGRFTHVVRRLCEAFPAPFLFFEQLAAYCEDAGFWQRPVGKLGQYNLLGSFAAQHGLLGDELQWLCRYDMALHEKPHGKPDWVSVDGSRPYREQVVAFYSAPGNLAQWLPGYAGYEPKQVLKMAHVEVFPFDPCTSVPCTTALLFDYTRRDVTGRAFHCKIPLELKGD